MDNFIKNIIGNEVNYARNQASWEAASEIERATFGRVFNFIQGGIALVVIFGCILISSATSNSQILQYVCGILWILPFVAVGILLGRFRQELFFRLRGVINGFLGGSR
jgi:hypothetical protein